MAVAVKKIDLSNEGVDKKNFEDSLQQISDQIRWIDQNLTLKVENEVWKSFQNHQNEINFTKSIIKDVPIVTRK